MGPGKNRNSMPLGTCVPIFALLEEVEPTIPKGPNDDRHIPSHTLEIHTAVSLSCFRFFRRSLFYVPPWWSDPLKVCNTHTRCRVRKRTPNR